MKRAAILCGLVLVAIIAAADTRHLGSLRSIYDFPYGDKIGHFVLYGILSLMVNSSVLESQPDRVRTRAAVVSSLILAAMIALEELSQRWIPSRTSSVMDLAASYAGIGVFAFAALSIRRRRGPPRVTDRRV